MKKGVKKVVAEHLLHFCKVNNELYKKQITRKYWFVIDAAALFMEKGEKV